jgi:hypothetical protein
MKMPVKQIDNKIVDAEETVVAKVTEVEYGETIVNSINLDSKTKAMSMDMWRLVNYFKNNPNLMEKDKNLEKSVKRTEKYLMKDVHYE